MQYLADNNLLKSDMLDYGCGRGGDSLNLTSVLGDDFVCWKYDPHYQPKEFDPTRCSFDVITCHYVLNVVDVAEGKKILKKIKALLADNGTAYITVRRNIKKEGFTSKGTYQRNVKLKLPVVTENSSFCIYKLTK